MRNDLKIALQFLVEGYSIESAIPLLSNALGKSEKVCKKILQKTLKTIDENDLAKMRLELVFKSALENQSFPTAFQASYRLSQIAKENKEDLSQFSKFRVIETEEDANNLLLKLVEALSDGSISPSRGQVILQSVQYVLKSGKLKTKEVKHEFIPISDDLTENQVMELIEESLKND